jgi:hypothetical protein
MHTSAAPKNLIFPPIPRENIDQRTPEYRRTVSNSFRDAAKKRPQSLGVLGAEDSTTIDCIHIRRAMERGEHRSRPRTGCRTSGIQAGVPAASYCLTTAA